MNEKSHHTDDVDQVHEVTVLPATAEKYITDAITKINKTEAGIMVLQTKYGALKITGPDDRASYLVASEGLKIVKATRVEVEKKRKELIAFPLKFQKDVNAEAKRITELLTPIETHIKKEVEDFENAAAAAKRVETEARHKQLITAGFKFEGAFYVAGIHMVPSDSIGDMTAEKLEYYIKEATSIIAAEKLAAERQAKETAELAAAKLELANQQAEFAKKLKDLEARELALKAKETPLQEPGQTGPTDGIILETPVKVQLNTQNANAGSPGPVVNATFGNPATGNIPAAGTFAKVDHVATMQDNIDAAAQSGHSIEYMDGFEHCREAILTIFNDPTPKTRAVFIQLITDLKA